MAPRRPHPAAHQRPAAPTAAGMRVRPANQAAGPWESGRDLGWALRRRHWPRRRRASSRTRRAPVQGTRPWRRCSTVRAGGRHTPTAARRGQHRALHAPGLAGQPHVLADWRRCRHRAPVASHRRRKALCALAAVAHRAARPETMFALPPSSVRACTTEPLVASLPKHGCRGLHVSTARPPDSGPAGQPASTSSIGIGDGIRCGSHGDTRVPMRRVSLPRGRLALSPTQVLLHPLQRVPASTS